MIRKVSIRNYRLFRSFDLSFSPGMNVLVGTNDTGKSTLVEAITLALTGRIHGRQFGQELSPFLINLDATSEYLAQLKKPGAKPPIPPQLVIEVVFDGGDDILRGTNNLLG